MCVQKVYSPSDLSLCVLCACRKCSKVPVIYLCELCGSGFSVAVKTGVKKPQRLISVCIVCVQKVFFEMQSDVTTTKYRSLVRSCAEHCVDQDDFRNCSAWQLTTMGCVRRTCCDDEDLCNAAAGRHSAAAGWALALTLLAACCSLVAGRRLLLGS